MEGAIDQIDTMSVNAIRVLTTGAVQKAKSGHSGLPSGAVVIFLELRAKHMNHNPKNPGWENRDRFVPSGGHDSTLLYSLPHLLDYGLAKESMMNFRQMDSLTPGYPEYDHTIGVEATIGPLGTGVGMVVGVAVVESHPAAVFNKDGYPAVDHFVYVLGDSSCMTEGISLEVFPLAGILGLGKLIVFYDSNRISIRGSMDIAFIEDIQKCMKAFGFQLITVEDGNDSDAIGKTTKEAKVDTTRPSFITVRARIDYGCPAKQGKASAYGKSLRNDNIKATEEFLSWPSMEPFCVPDEVYANYKTYTEGGAETKEKQNALLAEHCGKYPEMKELWDEFYGLNLVNDVYDSEDYWASEDRPNATRSLSDKQPQKLKNPIPNPIGGAADLASPTKTYTADMDDFSKDNYAGHDLHFGARELTMSITGDGLMLYGGSRAFVSTFFVFNDYTKPITGLSALTDVLLAYVFTHNSIGMEGDKPTYKSTKQLTILCTMPSFHVYRPADATEAAIAWCSAVSPKKTSTALVFTRQNLSQLTGSSKEALKEAHILEGSVKEVPDAIIIATGSEVELTVGVKTKLAKESADVRVVSMPSMDAFEEQPEDYREKVLPEAAHKRVAVGALGDFGQGKYVGLDGTTVAMRRFGVSMPTGQLSKRFGLTVESVVAAVKSLQA